jgi:hypothetical protein
MRTRASSAVIVTALAMVAAGCGGAPPDGPSPALDGIYALRVETSCAVLPADVRSRSYVAKIAGGNVTLSGAAFWMHPARGLLNVMQLQTAGDRVSLAFNQPITPDIRGIVEETSPGRYFGLVGTGTGTVTRMAGGGASIDGTFFAGFGWGENLLSETGHVGCPSGAGTSTFRFTPASAGFPPPIIAMSINRLEVAGPESVAPGATVQWTATGEMSDGTTRDLTNSVTWSRSSFAVRILSPGAIAGLTIGEANVSASLVVPNLLAGVSASREIVVVPAGTVRVAGRVTTGAPAQPVAGATVTVAAGSAVGLQSTTDWDGRYRLYGIAGETEIRVIKDGYEIQARTVTGTSHQTLDVTLPAASIPNIAGDYTFTMTSDPACAGVIPASLAVRTYTATLTQNVRLVQVSLRGVPFNVREGRGAGFPGQVDPRQATFLLDDIDHFDTGANPDVFEQVSPTSLLALFGTMTVDIAPGRLSGTLNGLVTLATPATIAGFFWGPECLSTRHQVVFAR